MEKHKYSYKGPVLSQGRLLADNWYGETVAVSANKALCNLSFQFKKYANRIVGTELTLPGKLIKED